MMSHQLPLRALDVAMGRGRHARVLAEAGFSVFGVDRSFDAVVQATRVAPVRAWCADLTSFPLPRDAFHLVVVVRYLQRDLFDALRASVVRGGFVLYETFTEAQRAHGRGPTSPAHLLRSGELGRFFEGWDTKFYDEMDEPDAVARIAAQRPA
jgi:SAM-dependent methyltransferase